MKVAMWVIVIFFTMNIIVAISELHDVGKIEELVLAETNNVECKFDKQIIIDEPVKLRLQPVHYYNG